MGWNGMKRNGVDWVRVKGNAGKCSIKVRDEIWLEWNGMGWNGMGETISWSGKARHGVSVSGMGCSGAD
eukprot:scaffold56740_cov17-Prasinocladus_malaysianus.AAC.1